MIIHIYKKEPAESIGKTRIDSNYMKYSKMSEIKEKCKLISYMNNYTWDSGDSSPCPKNNKCSIRENNVKKMNTIGSILCEP